MMSYSDMFRNEVEAFLSQSGLNPTDLGKAALSDPSFVFDLRNGRSPSAKTMDRVRSWIASQRAAA